MPMNLEQLRRERELIAHHLAWLDARIAEEEGMGAPAAQAAPVPPPPVRLAPQVARSPALAVAMPPMPADFDPELRHASAEDARKGCLKLFVGAVLLFVGLLVVAYFLWPDPVATR